MNQTNRPYRFIHIQRLLMYVAVPLLLAACAHPAIRQAERLRSAGQYEQALDKLQQAYRAKPSDTALKAAYVKQRDSTVAHLIYQSEMARVSGQSDLHMQLLQRLEAAAPEDPRVQALRADVTRRQRSTALFAEASAALERQDYAKAETALRALLAEDMNHAQARAMLAQIDEKRSSQTRQQTSLQLAASQQPITLEFRDANLRTVFETLARAANVNFVLDKDVRAEARVTLFMRNTTVEEAMRVILGTQQLGMKLLNDNTVLVYPNTSQKQRDLLDTVTRSFYLVNADPKQAMSLVRTVAKTRDIFVDERLNLLIVRDTPDVVRLIERLIASIDLPDPEVMLELEVMEVSSKRLLELGVTLPTTATLGALTNAGAIATTQLTTTSGLPWSIANPVAIATLRGTTDASNLLANPKIRARNREKAKITLGEKLPVFSSTTTTGTATSTAVNISYVDVGLKLELEPQIQLNDEVIIKVNLDVTNITNRVLTKNGDLAYQVGSRLATTSLRLKDGETQVLAGLINDDENKSSAGLPWLHELPGLGRLFGQTTNTHNKTEVVLLITPRVIRSLNQHQLPAAAMPSGTESLPGALPLVVPMGKVSTEKSPVAPAGQTPVLPATQPRAMPAVVVPAQPPGAALAPRTSSVTEPYMSGPQEVMPLASFQITIHNPGSEPLSSQLLYDPTVFEVLGDERQEGRFPVNVLPRGTMPVGINVMEGVFGRQAELRLESGGKTMNIVVGDPEP